MSTGHFHSTNSKSGQTELKRCLSSSRVRGRLAEKFRVDRTFDIPYLAGYSRTGKVIYVDRHLPIVLNIAGKRTPILQYLIIHERIEKALIDLMDLDYDEAHKIATFAEYRELAGKGITPAAYERALDPYIKADQHKKIERVPRDLDFKPYADSRDMKLIARMKEHLA